MHNAWKNKGSGELSARPYPAKLPSCEEELKKSLSIEGNQQQQKDDVKAIDQAQHLILEMEMDDLIPSVMWFWL